MYVGRRRMIKVYVSHPHPHIITQTFLYNPLNFQSRFFVFVSYVKYKKYPKKVQTEQNERCEQRGEK